MKQSRLFLLLPLVFASSCGEEEFNPDVFFDGFEAAAKAQIEADALSFTSTSGYIDTHFRYVDEEEGAKEVGVKLNPINVDLRIGGIHEASIDNVKASVQTKSSAGNSSRVYITGIDLPSVTKLSDGGIGLSPNLYLDDSRFYLDNQDAAVIPVALKNIDERYKDFPIRGYRDLSEEEKSDIDAELPLGDLLSKAVEAMKKEMKTAYEASSDDFLFQTKTNETLISFATKSWKSVRNILDAFIIDAKEAYGSEMSSSIDFSSILDEAEKEATIDNFRLSLSYGATKVNYVDYDFVLSFPETEESEDRLTFIGTWTFKGTVEVGNLSPVTLSNRDKNRYSEIKVGNADE